MAALLIASGSSAVAQEAPAWPTPPPAPLQPLPRVAPTSEIVPVSAPLVPGAGAALILPLAPGQLPRIPPIQSTFFETGDGIRLISQAGTLEVTVQLVYEPLPIEEVEPSGPHLTLLHAFDLDVFDHRARKHTPRLLRPWILEVPISSLPQAPVDPERLLIARWEDESGWIPLVTNYHRDSDLLVVGILQPGRYAVLQDSLVTLP